MVSGMMKKTMITLVLLGCAFLLPAQTKTTVQGRIENAENLRLYYYLNEESYPVSVDGDGRYNIELDLSDFTIIKFSPLTGYHYTAQGRSAQACTQHACVYRARRTGDCGF